MKQLFVIVLILVALVGKSFATNTQDKLYTLNNRVYTGYISTQIPGEQIIFISGEQVIPFNVSDLLMIKYEVPDSNLLTGLEDVIKTRTGKIYQGKITEQLFGKSIKIYTSSGEINIDLSDILEQQKIKMSKDHTLLEQAPYKNVIQTKKNEEYSGVILFQYYGIDETPSYLEISSEDGISKRIFISDIEQIRRIPNEKYHEVKVFSVEKGKVYFNQSEIDPIIVAKKKRGKHVTYYLEDKSIANHTIIDGGIGQLSVKMKENTEYSKYKLMKIEQLKIGKKNYYAYTEELAYKNNIEPYTSTIDNNKVMCKIYNVRKGMYLFYNQESNKVFFVEIK